MEGEIVDIELITIIIIIRCCMEGEIVDIELITYNNIIIRCCMEGDIVDIELITIIIAEKPFTSK